MKNIIHYLIQLSENNNREWFNDHRILYSEARTIFSEYVNHLIEQIAVYDKSVSKCNADECIFRIYRDTRFSPDKTPYKNHFGAYIAQGGRKSTRAGYYIHLQPYNESFAGGGIYMPEPNLLKSIRQEIYYNYHEFKNIIENPEFVDCFGGLSDFGRLKKAPLGFSSDWEGIDILKNKSFVVGKNIKDSELDKCDIHPKIEQIFFLLKNFNLFLNRV